MRSSMRLNVSLKPGRPASAFTATTPATHADGSAMFSIVASPNPDVLSGTVLVEEASSDIAGVLSVSLTFRYQDGS